MTPKLAPKLAIHPVTAPGAEPRKWLIFLHGILGSGGNWRTFARQIVSTKPEWGALLVDLRLHGESVGFPPPHTIANAAKDIVDAVKDKRISGLLGHSFGGKVAIECAKDMPELEQLFVIDSTPAARLDYRGSSGVRAIVEMLRELPADFPDRGAFQTWVEERGVGRPTAMWLAMNIRQTENGRFVFRLDIPSIRDMMEDYFKADLWPIIEDPTYLMQTHLVSGGKSEVVDAADRERATLAPRCTVDVIPSAGHWVHVDAPEELKRLVLDYLSA